MYIGQMINHSDKLIYHACFLIKRSPVIDPAVRNCIFSRYPQGEAVYQALPFRSVSPGGAEEQGMTTQQARKQSNDGYGAVQNLVPGTLVPGRVSIQHFGLLTAVCPVRSPGLLKALESVLVYGKTRREACEEFGITQSYFSVKYRRLQTVSLLAIRLARFFGDEQQT